MSIASKIALLALTTVVFSNVLTTSVVAKFSRVKQCSNPYPKSYRPPKSTKYIQIAELGITINSPSDHRLVKNDEVGGFEIMSLPQYKNHQCLLSGGKDYPGTSRVGYANFRAIKNPNKLPMLKFLEKQGDTTRYARQKINGIDFLTTPVDQGDPLRAWFVPKDRPDIVVSYSSFCDCDTDYKDLLNVLKRVRNI